ncbi:translesion error-prone DNA polymerase V autoproteolytic subunit [Mucilaginibacter sp. RB4R14]|uniref:LexA family protein n=1 Tax=Mucilaginibacter aurantiaciroseus TaxID=2949308 RepID=UPI00209001BF|nr:translesion error-prone DNA polymerase V autoproteolytic subunit [Mucilaginibacter aurantiaciroseus]
MKSSTNLQIYKFKKSETELPLFLSSIQAGFPSPADDYLEECLSLDDVCIANAASTFLGRITGHSLKDVCIYEGDIAVIDKSLKPEHRDLVVCAIDGEFNAKILHIDDLQGIRLLSANPDYKPIIIQELTDFRIWGVITFVMQDIKNRSRDWNY